MKDYFGYHGQICVVTGAASGMGKATCIMLQELGAEVYGMDLVKPDLDGIHYISVDLSKKESIDEAFRQIPDQIDAFFAAAGIAGSGRFPFERVFHVNFTANKYMFDTYLMERMRRKGAVAVISSMAGANWDVYGDEYKNIADAEGWEETEKELNKLDLGNVSDVQAYQLSKRAINYYCMKKIKDFGEKDVRINVLMPGSTLTPMTQKLMEDGLADELIKTDGVAGRLADVREMVEPFVFLNSNMASFLTGNMLFGDCGYYMMDKVGVQGNNNFYNFRIFG